ncbi:hypothetical protein [Hydrogenophaga sp. OTU3427]|uniref:hypothetical protein n=1 Tax=Hydrogenophaga sp. OTU3427 TaxID=3043856 RepID=UPI00313AB8E6
MLSSDLPAEWAARFAHARAQVHGSGPLTLLWMDAQAIHLAMGHTAGAQAGISLPLAPARLGRECLRHAPPRPGEIEQAIDVIEDALARVHGHVPGATLVSDEPAIRRLLQRLAPAQPPGVPGVAVEQVEAAFQHMASVAMGYPAGPDPLGATAEEAALLILVRELMHHLKFQAIEAVQPPQP